ncbi:4-phosphoerythronate dehydrogenase [Flocculibacter collagenilyticus]|uniref:4-phosphoerythronate dehydrogenase n=1 Tax=Flocculibacter collagenilyticus TaxID=2744479 RepID=UPI0018F30AFD|nr:4-phosphoerythronate dehydrogenase [Flocculibacter collagenilyticus]
MNIFYDENMPYVEAFFSELGQLTAFNGRTVTAEQVKDADILLVRSITKVDEALLSLNKKIKFVGTATIGVDHIDQPYLQSRNITFTNAPGCNAMGVADYVISSLLVLCNKYQRNLYNLTVGIVGLGNIGSRLKTKLDALGIRTLVCDPFKQRTDTKKPSTNQTNDTIGDISNVNYVSYEKLLAESDVVTFHVPLTKSGDHPTYHLLDSDRLLQLKRDAMIINASRGEVIDNKALLNARKKGMLGGLVLDVWENEPNILEALIPHTDIATAHIAGYSLEGKTRGTEYLYQAVCNTLNVKIKKALKEFLPSDFFNTITLNGSGTTVLSQTGLEKILDQSQLTRLVHSVYDVRRDDNLFRFYINGEGFDWLRKNYPVRREFSATNIAVEPNNKLLINQLMQLGFSQN